MRKKNKWKKVLSIVLSIVMVIGSMNIAKLEETIASEENLLSNSGFETLDSWIDQNGEAVKSQKLVDDVRTYDIVENGGFENGNYQSGKNGWQTQTSSISTLSVKNETDNASNKVLQVVGTAGGAQANFYMGEAGILEIGKTYTVSFDIRKTEGSGGLTLYSVNVISGWDTHGWKNITDDWNTITYEITPEQSTAWAQIGFQLDAACTVEIDNFSICYREEKTENIQVELVENGGFENGNYQSGKNGWQTQTSSISTLSVKEETDNVSNKVLQVVGTAGGAQANFYMGEAGILEIGKTYTVSFDIRKTAGSGGLTLYSVNVISGWDTHGWKNITDDWNTITYEITPEQSTAWAQIGFQLDAACTVEIDNFSIMYDGGTQVAKTYTEGIGTCKDLEPDNVLVMKKYTKVAQAVQIVAGATYEYSFQAKSEDILEDFDFQIVAGSDIGDNVSLTEEWTTFSGTFTATADATEFGFLRTGSGTVFIDDVVMTKISDPIIVTDHTTSETEIEGNMIQNGNFNEGDKGYNMNGNTVADGMCLLTNSYVQTNVSLTEGHTYRFSCYVWIINASDLTFDMFMAGDGSPEATWKDYIFGYGKLQNSTHTTSITQNMEQWEKISFEWVASKTGYVNLGFKIYAGSGTVYMDDMSLCDISPKTEITIPATVTNLVEVDGYYYIESSIPADAITDNSIVGQSSSCSVTVDGVKKMLDFNIGSTTYANFSGVTEYVKNGQMIVIPKNLRMDTTNYNITIDFGTDTTLEKIGQEYGIYTKVHQYPDNDNTSYFNIDNGTGYTLSSTNNAFQITQDGKNISKSVGDVLNTPGVFDIERVENGERFSQQIILYKNGDANADNVIDVKDLVAMKRITESKYTANASGIYAADINRSGKTDKVDLRGIRNALTMDDANTTLSKPKGESSVNGEMPIIGYNGPDYDESRTAANSAYKTSFVDDSIFNMVRDLGFNTVIFNRNDFGDQLERATKTLDLSEKYGFKAYLQDAYVSSAAGNGTTLQSNKDMEKRNARYDSYKSFGGYYIYDEPLIKNPVIASQGRPLLSSFATQLGMMKGYTNINGYCNLFPIISPTLGWAMQSSTSGVSRANYQKYMQAALDGGADVLSYDLYLRDNDGKEISREGFYQNIDEMRTMSASSKKPFMSFVQVGSYFDGDKITVSQSSLTTIQEMYLEANAPLAMGAKGISYFSLIQSIGNAYKKDGSIDLYRSGLINVAGEANHGESTSSQENYDYYAAAKKINTYIKTVDEVLMNAESKGVITNSTIKGYLKGEGTQMDSYGVVSSVEGSDALVGCFDYYGKDAFMVVNTSTKSNQTITLNMTDANTYCYTGMDSISHEGKGTLTLTNLGAGESVLVVID